MSLPIRIPSNGLLFLTFYHFPYTADPLTSTPPTWPFWPLHDHHRLYPISITPSVQYHVGDLSYDLWTTSLHFPFLVFSLYPTHSSTVWPIADCCTVRSQPYHTLHCTWTLCWFSLLFVFKTFVSTLKNKEVFPPELRLKFVLSHHFASLRLRTSTPSHLRSISYFRNPSLYRAIPNLRLTPLCTPWYYIRRPFHCSRIAPLRTT